MTLVLSSYYKLSPRSDGATLKFNITDGAQCMAKNILQDKGNSTQSQSLDISDKQTEILARRLLPENKRFFADEDIRQECEEWKNRQKSK
jgi:hypothetical protein